MAYAGFVAVDQQRLNGAADLPECRAVCQRIAVNLQPLHRNAMALTNLHEPVAERSAVDNCGFPVGVQKIDNSRFHRRGAGSGDEDDPAFPPGRSTGKSGDASARSNISENAAVLE